MLLEGRKGNFDFPEYFVGCVNRCIEFFVEVVLVAQPEFDKRYYDRMRSEAPELLGDNIRHWFQKYPAPRMIRTLDGGNRAFLSNSYRTLENEDLAEAVLPVLQEAQCLLPGGVCNRTQCIAWRGN